METLWELDRDSSLPLYLQIRQRLLAEITSWPDPEQRFYSDDELVNRFGVSKMTVRQSMNRLVEEGMLTRRRARGTFVSKRVFEERLSPRLDIGAQYEAAGATQEIRLLAFAWGEPTAEEQALFGSPAPVLRLSRVRSVGETPVAVDRRCMPQAVAEAAGFDQEAATGSIIGRLRSLPAPPVTADWVIMMRTAGLEEANALWVTRGSPLLVRQMVYRTAEGAAMLGGETMHAAHAARYRVTLDLDQGREEEN